MGYAGSAPSSAWLDAMRRMDARRALFDAAVSIRLAKSFVRQS